MKHAGTQKPDLVYKSMEILHEVCYLNGMKCSEIYDKYIIQYFASIRETKMVCHPTEHEKKEKCER